MNEVRATPIWKALFLLVYFFIQETTYINCYLYKSVVKSPKKQYTITISTHLRQTFSQLNIYVINDDTYDRRPRRLELLQPHNESNNDQRYKASSVDTWRDDWGVEYHNHFPLLDETNPEKKLNTPTDISTCFPSNVDEVTDSVATTIVAVLYNAIPTFPDPNILQNKVYGNTLIGRRPVRNLKHDVGRIGIELDWSLRDKKNNNDDDGINGRDIYDHSMIRYASLLLAGKLSNRYTNESKSASSTNSSGIIKSNLRPIAIYFNTVQQAIAASRQLYQLKRRELLKQQATSNNKRSSDGTSTEFTNDCVSIYDAIHIRWLCHDDAIPNDLIYDSNGKRRINYSSSKVGRHLATGQIDPHGGLIMIVQPTNYNDEFRPPGPSIGVIESIQRLITNASIEQLPVVMISPRFLKAQSTTSLFSGGGWDQSGYHQQSSLYAGLEPPKGPTPWILRDFTPPVFCYVANAMSIDSNKYIVTDTNHNAKYESFYSHLSLWQSVLHKGHAWNLFVAIRNINNDDQSIRYHNVATSKNSAGRPTYKLMQQIWNDYYYDLQQKKKE